MTDLTPGSRWLLPVTFDAFMVDNAEAGPAWVRVCGARITSINTYELDDLIPADRITELEAENARLQAHLDKFQGLYDAARGDVVEAELEVAHWRRLYEDACAAIIDMQKWHLENLAESEVPSQEELATTISGGHSEKFEWKEWEPDYKALYESERIEYARSEARYDDLRAAWAEDMKENDMEIDRLRFAISILAAVKPLDGSVGKEVW